MSFEQIALIVFACVGAGLIAGFTVILVRHSKRVNGGLSNARAQGWTILKPSPNLAHYWDGPPFNFGHHPQVSGKAVTGVHRGFRFVCFHYAYFYGMYNARHKESKRIVVLAVSAGTGLPDLAALPQSGLDRLWQKVSGEEDLTVGSEEFDRAFAVMSADPEFATSLLRDPAMQARLTVAGQPWTIQGGDLVTFTDIDCRFLPGGAVMQEAIEGLLAPLYEIPDGVWERYGGKPALLRPA